MSIKRYSKKRAESKKEEQALAKEFFDKAIEKFENVPYSFESGVYISNIDRVNICHLFPKRTYKSVQHDIENVILLTFEEHSRFDNLLDKMDFEGLERDFSSWNEIKLAMINLLPKITERGNLYLKFTDYAEK